MAMTQQVSGQAFWGLYGGINTANVSMSGWKTNLDPADQQPTFEGIRRLTFGATCELPLTDYFFLQPELALTQKGTVMKIDSGYGDVMGSGLTQIKTVNNLTLNYIQVPILFKARLQLTNPRPLYPNEGNGKPLFVEFYLGPTINYLMNGHTEYYQTIRYQNNSMGSIDTSYKVGRTGTQGGLKKFDLSATFGATFKWKASRKTYIYLDARYSMNFLNMNKQVLMNHYIDAKDGKEKYSYPTLKNAGNLAVTVGISTTFTKRRYWEHPRVKKRRF